MHGPHPPPHRPATRRSTRHAPSDPPIHPFTSQGVRNVHMGADGVFPAARAFQEAADLEPKPKTADVLGHLASTLACTPRLEEARKAALKALAVEPSRVDTLSLATRLTNFTDRNQTAAGEALMQKLLQLIKQRETALTPGEEAAVRFSLFKALDEIGEVTAASRQLEAANAVKEEVLYNRTIVPIVPTAPTNQCLVPPIVQ